MNSAGHRLDGLLRWPRRALHLLPKEIQVPVLSGPGAGLKWIRGSYANGCWLGTYEREKVRLFAAYARKAKVFWDIGANVGYFSLVAKRQNSRIHCIAFEPVPRNIRYLCQHAQMNQLDIHIMPCAIGRENGPASFDLGNTHGSGAIESSHSTPDVGRSIGTDRTVVPCHTVDSLLGIGIPAPDLAKMDIEGAETWVLPELLKHLANVNQRLVLFLAVHDARARSTCLRELVDRGYSVKPIGAESLDETDEWICV